jgi:hypothetical protein
MTTHFFLTPKFVFDEQKNEKVLYWLCYKNVELEPFRVVSDSDKTISSFVSEMMKKLKNKQSISINSNNDIRNNTGTVVIGTKIYKAPTPAPPSKSATIMKMKEVVIDTSMQRVEIKNGRLYIDGKAVSSEGNMFAIERMVVKGNSNLIVTDNSPVTVTGDVVSVTTKNGKVNIKGNVSGNIKVDNGNVVVSGTSGDCFVTNGSAKSESIKKKKEATKTRDCSGI